MVASFAFLFADNYFVGKSLLRIIPLTDGWTNLNDLMSSEPLNGLTHLAQGLNLCADPIRHVLITSHVHVRMESIIKINVIYDIVSILLVCTVSCVSMLDMNCIAKHLSNKWALKWTRTPTAFRPVSISVLIFFFESTLSPAILQLHKGRGTDRQTDTTRFKMIPRWRRKVSVPDRRKEDSTCSSFRILLDCVYRNSFRNFFCPLSWRRHCLPRALSSLRVVAHGESVKAATDRTTTNTQHGPWTVSRWYRATRSRSRTREHDTNWIEQQQK